MSDSSHNLPIAHPRRFPSGGREWVLVCLLATTTLMFLLPGSLWAEIPGVQVRASAEVSGSRYTLGEIADIQSTNPQLIESLAQLAIGRAPRPGRSLSLNISSIKSQLTRRLGPKGFTLDMPRGAVITRASQFFSGSDIAEMVRTRALELAGEGNPGHSVGNLDILTKIHDAHLPLGDMRWEIKAQGQKMTRGGTRSYRVVAFVDGRSQWNALVRTRLELMEYVVVAIRPISRNAKIKAEDIRVESRRVNGRLPQSTLSDPEQVLGKPALRPIAPNELIRANMVREPLSVEEGGRVTLLYQGQGVRFKAVGVALINGKNGQFIPVRNLQSGKIVYGVVQEHEVVKVN